MKSYAIKLVVLVAAVLMLAACTQPKSSIGVVNTAKIYQESEAGKAGVKHLEALHEEMQNEINKMQAELQKNPSDDVKRQFQQLYTDYEQRMGAEQQQVITVLNESLQKVLDAYREKSGLDVIVANEGVLSSSPKADVTSEIVAELNKQTVTFKRLEADAPKADPAKPAN